MGPLNLPVGHGRRAVDRRGQYQPGEHSCGVASVEGQYAPTGQSASASAPAAQCLPGAPLHAPLQLDERSPLVLPNRPAAHNVPTGAVAPGPQNEPAAAEHGPEHIALLSPVALPNRPAGQGEGAADRARQKLPSVQVAVCAAGVTQ